MANSKQRGRPKTSKSNRVKVSIMLDPDLVDWSRDKRSDMVNRLLRLYKNSENEINIELWRRQMGFKPILLDSEADAILNGSPVDSPFKGLVDDRITLKEANYILEQLAKGQPKPPKDKP